MHATTRLPPCCSDDDEIEDLFTVLVAVDPNPFHSVMRAPLWRSPPNGFGVTGEPPQCSLPFAEASRLGRCPSLFNLHNRVAMGANQPHALTPRCWFVCVQKSLNRRGQVSGAATRSVAAAAQSTTGAVWRPGSVLEQGQPRVCAGNVPLVATALAPKSNRVALRLAASSAAVGPAR